MSSNFPVFGSLLVVQKDIVDDARPTTKYVVARELQQQATISELFQTVAGGLDIQWFMAVHD